ncbi:hypothetical protein LTR08_003764 [Meristemomyces frigidus]|nr:hypothetical protein LTR08_003764 [Meristemomyces frigidus]
MDAFKRKMRMWFGGRKGKQEQEQDNQRPTSAAQWRSASAAQKPTAAITARQPPLAPPKDTPQPVVPKSPDTTKELPPTHPLSAGRNGRPQVAVPIDHTVEPDSAPSPVIAGKPVEVAKAREHEEAAHEEAAHEVSPTAASPASHAADDRPASATERDQLPVPPPKTDDAADAICTAPSEAAVTNPAAAESHPAHITSTAERLNPATAMGKENAVPNDALSDASEPLALDTVAAQQRITRLDDSDKIVVGTEEPPPIKAVKAAPGMSATSGPLEDFPEGEFH